jgi:hypothetical protein
LAVEGGVEYGLIGDVEYGLVGHVVVGVMGVGKIRELPEMTVVGGITRPMSLRVGRGVDFASVAMRGCCITFCSRRRLIDMLHCVVSGRSRLALLSGGCRRSRTRLASRVDSSQYERVCGYPMNYFDPDKRTPPAAPVAQIERELRRGAHAMAAELRCMRTREYSEPKAAVGKRPAIDAPAKRPKHLWGNGQSLGGEKILQSADEDIDKTRTIIVGLTESRLHRDHRMRIDEVIDRSGLNERRFMFRDEENEMDAKTNRFIDGGIPSLAYLAQRALSRRGESYLTPRERALLFYPTPINHNAVKMKVCEAST